MSFVCVYILKKTKQKKKSKKKIQDFQNFPRKREKFSKKKKKKGGLWTRGILPLSHLKKNFFELGALDFLVIFFKKDPFFSFKSSFQNGT